MSQREKYNVLKISDEQVLENEQLGSKTKFWVSMGRGEEEQDWLFKIPRKNLGEHWAEKVSEKKVQDVDSEQLKEILDRIPDHFISDTERTFALKMLDINQDKLKELL